eukprot:EG_transcript_11481
MHVALPCDDALCWAALRQRLLLPRFASLAALEAALHDAPEGQCRLDGLRQALRGGHEDHFLATVLPFIQREAVSLPERLGGQRIPVLGPGSRPPLRLPRPLVSSLLACAFFSLYSNNRVGDQLRELMPEINMKILLNHCPEHVRFVLNYFDRIAAHPPKGTVTITRRALHPVLTLNEWLAAPVPLSKVTVHLDGGIEDAHGMLEADFANMYLGGGVLNGGCVQEEIRFLLSPECIVGMLMCPRMEPTEAILIEGVERFSRHSGYIWSLAFKESYEDPNKDEDGQPLTCIVAFDALDFRPMPHAIPAQYSSSLKLRELTKAHAAFEPFQETGAPPAPLASGNWGCGAFLGCKHLKMALQWAAASAAGRPLHYFVFGDRELAAAITALADRVEAEKPVSVGNLISLIFRSERQPSEGFLPWLTAQIGEGGTEPTPPASKE